MISKTDSIRRMLTLKREEVISIVDYPLYKYSDIQKKSIICEGHLNYRYDQIKFLNMSQFAIYYVVLAKIPIEDEKEIIGIYLYRNQKQKPSNFFQLNEYEKISDQCSKPIKSKYHLFELVGKDQNDYEIFGAQDANERGKWVKHISQGLNWTQQNVIPNNLPISHPVPRRSWKEAQEPEHTDADVHLNYESFNENRRSSLPIPNRDFKLPHRPVPPIPPEKPLYSNEKNPKGIQRNHSFDSVRTAENHYLAAKDISHTLIKEEDDENENQTKIIQSNHRIKTIEDKPFTWNDIFYDNKLDNHARILNDISQIGAFLIRPQLNKNNSNDHDYALSIYAFGGIIKYKILKFSNNRYSLVSDYNAPNFANIPELCQYYTNHPLPRSTLQDDLTKGPVGNLCLKLPYTYYSKNLSEF